MITTDNIKQLIKEYKNHNEIYIEMVTRANGNDIQIWKVDEDGYNLNELEPGIKFQHGDYITYYSSNDITNSGDLFSFASSELCNIKIDELITFFREKKLKELGI